jgi:hypothetical protein
MSRVFFNVRAEQDMSDIVTGLLLWTKVSISEEEALKYVDDIYIMANSISDLTYHQKCKYFMHCQYGEYNFKYKRNYRTTWYIVYDIDPLSGDIFINRIISNHITSK